MASLALLASLITLSIILSGPLSWILSRINIIPNIIIYLIGSCTIFIGVWFFLLPIAGIRYIGLVSAWLGWLSINKRLQHRKTNA